MYVDYKFDISEQGLKLCDKASPNTSHQVQIDKTPLEVGDMFCLELDEDGCMNFVKQGAVQLGLNFYGN